MGVLLCFALHLTPLLLLQVGLILLAGVGITQVLYILPAYLIAKNKGEMGIAKGLLIGAGITFLLNATCFGVIIVSLGKGGFH